MSLFFFSFLTSQEDVPGTKNLVKDVILGLFGVSGRFRHCTYTCWKVEGFLWEAGMVYGAE